MEAESIIMNKFALIGLLLLGTAFAQTGPQSFNATEALIQGTAGQFGKVIEDKMDQVNDPANICYYLRTYKIEYKFTAGEESNVLYYTVYQCLKQTMDLVYQKVYFSADPSKVGEILPAGCPPPVIQPPQAPDPCKNGFAVGDVISRTVARLVVPKLVSDTDTNPIAQEPIFKEYLELQKSVTDPDFTTFTAQQQEVINKVQELISAVANEKIKCFTEEVTPVREMDIKFVCAKEGAYQSIADALKAALGDQITCQHIACDQIQSALVSSMSHDVNSSVGTAITYNQVPGDADIFGNIQSPLEDVAYILYSKPASLVVGPVGVVERDAALEIESCLGDNSQKYFFVKTGTTDFWKIKTFSGDLYLTYNTLGGDLVYRPLSNGIEQNWQLRLNTDGSVSLVNQKEPVLLSLYRDMTVSSTHVITITTMGSGSERFLIRKDCLNPVVPGVPLLSGNVALPVADQIYFIRNIGSGLVLNDVDGVEAGKTLAQNGCGKHANQSWKFAQRADGSWNILTGDGALLVTYNPEVGLVLDTAGANKQQAWKLITDDQGVLRIHSIDDSTYGLTIPDANPDTRLLYAPVRNMPLDSWAIRKTC